MICQTFLEYLRNMCYNKSSSEFGMDRSSCISVCYMCSWKPFLPQVIHEHITLLKYLLSPMLIFPFLVIVIVDLQFLLYLLLQLIDVVYKITHIIALFVVQIWKCNQIYHTFLRSSIKNLKWKFSYGSIHQIIIWELRMV